MRWLNTPRRRIIALATALCAVVAWVFVYDRFFHEEPAPFFASDEEHFL